MIKSCTILLFLGVSLFGSFVQAQISKAEFDETFLPHIILVKLNAENKTFFAQLNSRAFAHKMDAVLEVVPMFENHSPQTTVRFLGNENEVDLSLIYSLKIKETVALKTIMKELLSLEVFEYVERKKVQHISFNPNDPEINKQSYLTQINAYNAWDITKGSKSIKVGVVDTGTDMDHPDLQSEMSINTGDPINGIDDDNDGYIDNYNGWDFEDDDGIPQIVNNSHGIHVAGISAAATHNSVGVASVGYKSSFMPIRVGDGTVISYGYEGIVYAADMGCDVINCSWGSFGYSQFEQDIINYATFNKDALVVCAAGNQNRDQKYYPAAYENSFAVASINRNDVKSSFTNQGYWVDISAPGENIYATVNDGLYNYNTGTSMAAPVVSGAAALLKSKYPQLSALQLAERLKTTSDPIDGLNPGFENKIGVGRLNIGQAVTGNIVDASVVFGNVNVTNNTDDIIKGNDSLLISGTFTNYLGASGNVTASISSNSIYLINNKVQVSLGTMASLVQMDNYANPFSFKVLPSAPHNTLVTFQVDVSDGTFSNAYFIEVVVNVDYLNIAINHLATSVGSKGQFGYNGRDEDQGLGIRYKNGVSQLYEGGLMIGFSENGETKVVDRVRNSGLSWDDDFKNVQSVKEVQPPLKGQYFIQGIFNDSNAALEMLGLTILQSAYASTDAGHENYVVLAYEIINQNPFPLDGLYVGLFADFDVADYNKNRAYTDLNKFYTFTQSTQGTDDLFAVQLLTPGAFGSYCLNNVSGGSGGVDIYNGFNTAKKFTTLSTNRYNSGFQQFDGTDVIQVTAIGDLLLLPGDTQKVAFALMAAEYKELLDEVADSAYKRFNGVLPNSVNEQEWVDVRVFPNPAQKELWVDVGHSFKGTWSVEIFDITGRRVVWVEEKGLAQKRIDLSRISSGVYIICVRDHNKVFNTKLIKNSD